LINKIRGVGLINPPYDKFGSTPLIFKMKKQEYDIQQISSFFVRLF